MTVEVLAIGAHPDDVELGVGGLIHKMSCQGYRVGILDLSRGEKSTRGTVEERTLEAAEAARWLGVVQRENAGLPDSEIANTPEQRLRVISAIRHLRPSMILAPMDLDRHPDHEAAHQLIRDAAFFAGLAKIDSGQEPFRPSTLYFYHPYCENGTPSFIVDISEHFETKLAALRAYASQFLVSDPSSPETYISSTTFWETIRTRAAYWGSRIHVAFGEPLYSNEIIGVSLPPGLEKRP